MCALGLCLVGGAAAQESTPASAPSQQTQARQAPPVRVSRNISQARSVKIVLPRYPQNALAQHIEGDVLMKIVVTEDGTVDDAVLISGQPLLGTAAIDAVKLWKFRPFLLSRKPVKIETEAALRFEIDSSDGTGRVFIPDTPASGVVGDTPGGLPADQSTVSTHGLTSSAPVQAPGTGSSERVRVSQKVAALFLAKKVAPAYPPEALNGRIQGLVVLHVVVSKAGDVDTVELISGHPLLVPAAIDAVKQWKYKPYLLQGKPVEMDTQIQVNFVLPENRAPTLG